MRGLGTANAKGNFAQIRGLSGNDVGVLCYSLGGLPAGLKVRCGIRLGGYKRNLKRTVGLAFGGGAAASVVGGGS